MGIRFRASWGFLALLFLIPPASAQITTVSGTVNGSDGIPYAAATLKAQLVLAGAAVTGQPTVTNNSSASCRQAGFGNAPCQIPFQGTNGPITFDPTGSFTLNLQDNTQVTPASTQWLLSVTTSGIPLPGGTGPQSCAATVTISGSSQVVTSNFTCPALSRIPTITNGITVGNGTPTAGQDLGLQVNNAFASLQCGNQVNNQCGVTVTPGNYTFSTTINFPDSAVGNTNTNACLIFQPGVFAQYTGSADAILAVPASLATASNNNICIIGWGAKLSGTAVTGNGFHCQAASKWMIWGLQITNFNVGEFNEACSSGDYFAPNLRVNNIGVVNRAGTFFASPFSANAAVHHGGSIIANNIWGVFDDATNVSVSANFGNQFLGSTIQGNGSTTSNVNISTCSRSGNVVTLTTQTNIAGLVNELVRINGSTGGATSFNGYFKILSSNGTTQVTYAQTGPNESCTASTGTARRLNGNVFNEGGNSYVFTGWMETSGGSSGGQEAHIYVGTNNQVAKNTILDKIIIGDGLSPTVIDNINGANTSVNFVTVPIAMTNLVDNTAFNLSTSLMVFDPNANVTTLVAGCLTSACVAHIVSPKGYSFGSAQAPGSTANDITVGRAIYWAGMQAWAGNQFLFGPSAGESDLQPSALAGGLLRIIGPNPHLGCNGNDCANTVTCSAGTVAVTFTTTYTVAPIVTVSDRTTAGGARISTGPSATGFTITCTGATDTVDYHVIAHPN